MGQGDVLKFFERNPKSWVTAREVMSRINLSRKSIIANAKKLCKQGYLEVKKVKRGSYNCNTYKLITKKR